MEDRSKLPFRKNCEGYLILGDSLIARNTTYGYIDFPGGGVDDGEDLISALKREAFEEAGVILEEDIREVATLNTTWPSDWAKNEKQKKRFEKFQGDEMHFFVAKVKKLLAPSGDENEKGEENNGKWDVGERLMKISDAIKIIENYKPFPKALEEYYTLKLKILKQLK